jgi:hypothetical protein
MQKIKHYFAERTPVKFHASDDFVRGIMGPIGSGKSVACCMEILSRAARQRPNAYGVRKSRWCVVRNTYGELKSTSIKTWQDWVSEESCPIVYDSPIRGLMVQPQEDGTTIELEMLFLALDRPDQVKKLLSLELTGAWINEAREVPKAILDGLTGRVGRYPNKSEGGASWSGIIMDTNPPDDDHWWYRCAEEETPIGWHFWQQPPALIYIPEQGYVPNPDAENVSNHVLGYEYWLRQVPGKTQEWIKVYIMGQYGNIQEGKPVFPEYNDDLHCAKTILQPYTNLPLILSFDFGLTPAAVFSQLSPRGQFRVIDELVSSNMGIKQFMRDAVMPLIDTDYRQWLKDGSIYVVGDPAGNQRVQTDEDTCFDVVRSFGFRYAEPASTNSFITRREAVAEYMIRLTDGQPAFLLSPKCKILRRGFLGGYRYRRIQVAGDERFTDVPDKNQFSHPQDGLQYGALRANQGNLEYGKFDPRKFEEIDDIRCAGAM